MADDNYTRCSTRSHHSIHDCINEINKSLPDLELCSRSLDPAPPPLAPISGNRTQRARSSANYRHGPTPNHRAYYTTRNSTSTRSSVDERSSPYSPRFYAFERIQKRPSHRSHRIIRMRQPRRADADIGAETWSRVVCSPDRRREEVNSVLPPDCGNFNEQEKLPIESYTEYSAPWDSPARGKGDIDDIFDAHWSEPAFRREGSFVHPPDPFNRNLQKQIHHSGPSSNENRTDKHPRESKTHRATVPGPWPHKMAKREDQHPPYQCEGGCGATNLRDILRCQWCQKLLCDVEPGYCFERWECRRRYAH